MPPRLGNGTPDFRAPELLAGALVVGEHAPAVLDRFVDLAPAPGQARLDLLLDSLGHGGGHEDAVAPHDRARVSQTRQLRLPEDVLAALDIPARGRIRPVADAVRVGASEARPVDGGSPLRRGEIGADQVGRPGIDDVRDGLAQDCGSPPARVRRIPSMVPARPQKTTSTEASVERKELAATTSRGKRSSPRVSTSRSPSTLAATSSLESHPSKRPSSCRSCSTLSVGGGGSGRLSARVITAWRAASFSVACWRSTSETRGQQGSALDRRLGEWTEPVRSAASSAASRFSAPFEAAGSPRRRALSRAPPRSDDNRGRCSGRSDRHRAPAGIARRRGVRARRRRSGPSCPSVLGARRDSTLDECLTVWRSPLRAAANSARTC